MSSSHPTRRQFISSAFAAAGTAMLPRGISAAERSTAGHGGRLVDLGAEVQPFSLKQVRLLDGPFKDAAEANRIYLHQLPADRLLHMFRLTAGLPSSAQPLGGWEKPDCELRGHFSGGHYLSACALLSASQGDDDLRRKADAMVQELARCQRQNGHGYLSAFPTEFFDRLRKGKKVWAPFYTYHKIMAGHLDMYLQCGNEQALQTAERMAGWARGWSKSIGGDQMQRILNVEYGGMQEVLANLYAATRKEEYLALSRRFDHQTFFDPLAEHRDQLEGLHANTHIPQVVGVARRYELAGNPRDREIADYFWREVTSRRCYSTGGTSNREHWRTRPGILASELGKETQECCVEYNMLKLTRHLYSWTADPRAMDYYERTLFNSRLGTQHPSNGMKMYFLPLAPGYWKFFSSPFDSFWCCVGTGAEEFSKFGDSIYWRDPNGIYVNLYVASEIFWPERGIRVRQETQFPQEESSALTALADRPVQMALNLRVPWWAVRGATVKINGAPQDVPAIPSSYIALNRVWTTGDKVEISLPMSLHVAAMPDDGAVQAMMYGPLVLAGRLGSESLTRGMLYGQYNEAPKGKPVPAPEIHAGAADLAAWVEPVPGMPLTFRTAGQSEPIELIPLYKLFDERYAVYWKVRNEA